VPFKHLPESEISKPNVAKKVLPYGTLVLVCLASMLNQADRTVMPLAMVSIAEDFKWSRMQQGCAISAFSLGGIPMQVPSGYVSVRHDPLHVLFGAVVGWSSVTLLTPVVVGVGSFRGFVACRVALGAFESLCYPACMQLLMLRTPLEWRTCASAGLLAGGSIGHLVAIVISPLLQNWAMTFTFFGAAGFVWCSMCAIYAVHLHISSPQKNELTQLTQEPECEPESLEGGVVMSRTLVTPPLIAICVAHFSNNWTSYTLAAWLPTYFHQVLGVPNKKLYIMALPYLVQAVAGLSVGVCSAFLVERGKCSVLGLRRGATAVGLLGPAVLLCVFASLRRTNVAIATMALIYLFGSATSSGYMANHADLFPAHAGLTFSIASFFGSLPGLFTGPLTAQIVGSHSDTWWRVFYLAAAVNTVGAVSYVTFAKASRMF